MLTITIPEVKSFSGGLKILDLRRGGYTAQDVNTLLDVLGVEGRNAYLYHQIPVDMLYPFLFAITYSLLLAYMLNKIGKLNSSLVYLCFITLVSGFFDYCENIGIITILTSYPHNSIVLTQVTSAFTVLKSTLTSIYFVVITITFLVFGYQKLKSSTNI